jgi:hypothetical protein
MKFTISCDENPCDSGIVANGIVEREVNFAVSHFLVAALRRCGQTARFDETLTYVERVAAANADGDEVVVACAHNAGGNNSDGTEFVFCPGGKELGRQLAAAEAIGAELVNDGITVCWSTRDEQVFECCEFHKDTVFIAYLSLKDDRGARVIKSPGYAGRVAEATCRGLAKTYGFAYVAPGEAPPPGITWVAFSGTAMKDWDLIYDHPDASARVLRAVPKGTSLGFDGYTYNHAPIDDLSLGTPDRGWFHIDAGHGSGWTPSAWVNGTPPNYVPDPRKT